MKSNNEIDEARKVVNVRRAYEIPGSIEDAMLCGLSVALCWVAENKNGSTLQRLIDEYKAKDKANEN